MPMVEYWIGEKVDFRSLWDDFESGGAYIDKYQTMTVHLICLTFEQYPSSLPLFNHEAVFKTVKGYFHDLKRTCFTYDEYASAGPLFIYEINRGSGIWSFLGELRQLLLLGITLAGAKVVGQEIENIDRKLAIINRYFAGAANPQDFRRFMTARTQPQLRFAVQKLVEQRLQKIEISTGPFTGNIDQAKATLVNIGTVLENTDYLVKLRRILVTRFSEGELRTLCFDIRIDYDILPGEGKENKARELLDFLDRRHRVHVLVEAGKRLRPDIIW